MIHSNSFALEIEGLNQCNVSEVSGLETETDVTEVQLRNKKGHEIVQKSAAKHRITPGKLTVKTYDKDTQTEMKKWHKECLDGKGKQRSGSVILFDEGLTEFLRYNFFNAFPSKVTISGFSAKSTDPLEMEITIDHEGLQLA